MLENGCLTLWILQVFMLQIATPIWEDCTANPVAFIPCSNSLSFCVSTKIKMPPGKILLKTGVEVRTRGMACTKRIFAESDPWDFTSQDGTATFGLLELIQNACTGILWRIPWSCLLTSCSFSETKTVITFKSKSQAVWWLIRTNISWLIN